MVTETAPEVLTQVTESDSTPSTPASEAASDPSSQQTEVVTGEQGAETPADSGKAPEPARPVSDLSSEEQEAELKSLKDKALNEGTSPEENTRIDRLQQAVTNRTEERTRFLAGLERDQGQVRSQLIAQNNAEWTQIEDFLELNSLQPRDKELLNVYMQRWGASFNRIHHESVLAKLRQHALETLGDTPDLRQKVFAATDPIQLAKDIGDAREERGKGKGAGPEATVFKTKKELDAHNASIAKKALDDFKAKNPTAFPPSGDGRATPVGGWTYERYLKATPEERRLLPTDVERRLIREEMARRSRR